MLLFSKTVCSFYLDFLCLVLHLNFYNFVPVYLWNVYLSLEKRNVVNSHLILVFLFTNCFYFNSNSNSVWYIDLVCHCIFRISPSSKILLLVYNSALPLFQVSAWNFDVLFILTFLMFSCLLGSIKVFSVMFGLSVLIGIWKNGKHVFLL